MDWTENDIKFYTASANKAGAYSWMASKTKNMYEKRKFVLHMSGILITTSVAGWGIIVGIISKNQKFLAISMIVTAILTLIGTTLNNIDKLLNYDDEIQSYTSLMEANQLFYWDIYRTLQAVTSGTSVDKNIFKGTMDEREAQLIKKFKPFPQKIIDAYYEKFGEHAVDYNVLFNDKIDPSILQAPVIKEMQENDLIRLNIQRKREKSPQGSLSSSEEDNIVPSEIKDTLSSPRPVMNKRQTLNKNGKAIKLTAKQQYELDKYLLNFEDSPRDNTNFGANANVSSLNVNASAVNFKT
jgi:hypothetical protein